MWRGRYRVGARKVSGPWRTREQAEAWLQDHGAKPLVVVRPAPSALPVEPTATELLALYRALVDAGWTPPGHR